MRLATVTSTSPLEVLMHGDVTGADAPVSLVATEPVLTVADVVLVEEIGRKLVIVQKVEVP